MNYIFHKKLSLNDFYEIVKVNLYSVNSYTKFDFRDILHIYPTIEYSYEKLGPGYWKDNIKNVSDGFEQYYTDLFGESITKYDIIKEMYKDDKLPPLMMKV